MPSTRPCKLAGNTYDPSGTIHLAGQKHLDDASQFPGIKALLKVILVLLATSAGPYNRELSLC